MTLFLNLIPLCPLIGAPLAFLIGKKVPALSGWIATAASFMAFLIVCYLYLGLNSVSPQVIESAPFTWISVAGIDINFGFRFDVLSAVMCLFVTGVGSLIHLYAIGYMAADDSRPRFFAYLNLFLFSMLLLVLGANLLVLFIGWEGVGLCSYLLIGFWFKNANFAAAGRKAFVVNRIGDAGFLLGIFFMLKLFGSADFVTIASGLKAAALSPEMLTLIALCFFVGAVGKSAQIPLFVWLPDAMAGPTPVSALIHAATMVTAGVYLLARMNFLFDMAPVALFVVSIVALLTAFVAGSTAIVQNDIKKVLAYSTVSQLGFMFLAAGQGAYIAAIFHVVTHAFFKACLFMCAGSVIHCCHHEQDMRNLGGLRKAMPITFICYLLATLAIAGVYPFAGFQSKHAILLSLEHTTNPYVLQNLEFFVIAAKLTAFLTAFYMTRSLAMTFFGAYRGHHHPHEAPAVMVLPVAILAVLSVVGGVLLAESLPHYLSGVLPELSLPHEGGILAGIIGSWLPLAGIALGFLLYTSLSAIPGRIYKALGPVGTLLSGKYYFDEIYRALIIGPLEGLASFLFRAVDQGVIDATVNGTAAAAAKGGSVSRYIQSGQARYYALMMFVGGILLLGLSLSL